MLTTEPASSRNRGPLTQRRYRLYACVAVLVLSNVFVLRTRPRLQLRLEMSSSVASIAQLFYDVGRGYNERDSKIDPVTATSPRFFQRVSFDLPAGNISGLRFDPLTREGSFSIRNVRIASAGGTLRRFLPDDIIALNQIQSRRIEGDAVRFSTIPAADDPGTRILLRAPIDYKHEARRSRRRLLIASNTVILGLSLLFLFASNQLLISLRIGWRLIQWAHRSFARMAAKLSNPEFIRFDAFAIWFYVICCLLFAGATSLDLNGSSISIYSSHYGRGAKEIPWLGEARDIRSDEWQSHTPNILNEELRANRFDPVHTTFGGHSMALLSNLPVRHVTTLFRPQFWPFFVLPIDYAYSAYWQFKALLVLTGTFTWLLLVTDSTFWAAAGALWFFFSPSTQWDYSWASLLPEMIGSICFVVVCACFLTVGQKPMSLFVAALGLATFAINFGMCAYLPHLIPLAWLAIAFLAGWCVMAERSIFTRTAVLLRIGAVCGASLLICLSGLSVYLDTRTAISGVANTTYPGRRVFPPGIAHIQDFTSHFFSWSESAAHFPVSMGNICEAAGFIWLAPVTLFCIGGITISRRKKFFLAALWCFVGLVLAWLLLPLPVPAPLADLIGLDRTYTARAIPALGLANIAVVACIGSCRFRRNDTPGIVVLSRTLGTFLVAWAILSITDSLFGFVFTSRELLFNALLLTILTVLLIEGYARTMVLLLIAVSIITFGAVNPIEHGLGVITSSAMYYFIETHPDTRNGMWVVYSNKTNWGEMLNLSGFITAMGCQVYTGLHYLPDVDHFSLFASRGINVGLLNQAGFLFTKPLPSGEQPFVDSLGTGLVRLNVSPQDPLLKDLGIRYVAFDDRPAASDSSKLVALSTQPIDGFWVYRLP